MSWNFQKVAAKTATATLVAANAEDWIKVTPAAATTITLPAVKDYSHPQALKISNEDGAYAVTITANTSKPDYIVTREKAGHGIVLKTEASLVLVASGDYVILEADPIMGYWYIAESGVSSVANVFVGPMAILASPADGPGMTVKINDFGTGSSDVKAFDLRVTNSGTKSGTWFDGMYIGLTLGAVGAAIQSALRVNVGYANAVDLSGGYAIAIHTSMEEMGSVGVKHHLYLADYTTTAITSSSFIWMREQGSAQLASAFLFQGNKLPLYFLKMAGTCGNGFWDAGAGATSVCCGHLKVSRPGGLGDAYIRVYETAS